MFWGEEVQFNKAVSVKKEEYALLHLRRVCVLWSKETLKLVCEVKKANSDEQPIEIVLCHLDDKQNKQHTLNLLFDLYNQDIEFKVIGKGKVALIGSIEGKEGKALTEELVKKLKPQIQQEKQKMLLNLLKLSQENQGDEGEDNEDIEEDDSYSEDQMEEEDEDNEEDDEEDDEDDGDEFKAI